MEGKDSGVDTLISLFGLLKGEGSQLKLTARDHKMVTNPGKVSGDMLRNRNLEKIAGSVISRLKPPLCTLLLVETATWPVPILIRRIDFMEQVDAIATVMEVSSMDCCLRSTVPHCWKTQDTACRQPRGPN